MSNNESSRWDASPYEMNRVVRIPTAVPELGVEPGDRGVVAHVWDGGRMLDVEIPKLGGVSAGFVDLEVSPDGSTYVVGYSTLSTWERGRH
jgi:hypothetical protein